MQDDVAFGFRNVPPGDKPPLVRQVFDRVADRYDLMNDLMSGGLHRWWKNNMIAWLNPQPGMHVADVAGGTGDIAFRILKEIRKDSPPYFPPVDGGDKKNTPPACGGSVEGGRITIIDINPVMLAHGRDRAIDRNLLRGVDWVCADAEALPLPDAGVDAYTIAFGIRNVTHLDAALKEAARVLKIGGRFLCLEFSEVPNETLRKLYDSYSFHVIPRIGEAVTGSRDSYQYLVESIRRFPNQKDFAARIEAAGFGNVQYRNMTQGVVALHSARKL